MNVVVYSLLLLLSLSVYIPPLAFCSIPFVVFSILFSANRVLQFFLYLLSLASLSILPLFLPSSPAAFLTQTVNLDDTTVKFEIWDTAGQERYHSLAPMYYRGAQAAIVVYDITNMVGGKQHIRTCMSCVLEHVHVY